MGSGEGGLGSQMTEVSLGAFLRNTRSYLHYMLHLRIWDEMEDKGRFWGSPFLLLDFFLGGKKGKKTRNINSGERWVPGSNLKKKNAVCS